MNLVFLQKKHPHVIYEYSDRSPQGCAVPSSFVAGSAAAVLNPGSSPYEQRSQRNVDKLLKFLNSTPSTADADDDDDVLDANGNKAKRDVRMMQKFIETALVIDKAMVNSLNLFLGSFEPLTS